jgi:hypothetical protein
MANHIVAMGALTSFEELKITINWHLNVVISP